MAMNKKTQEDIGQLQLIQQQLQVLVSQKQLFQQRLNEIDNSLEEVNKTDKPANPVLNISP